MQVPIALLGDEGSDPMDGGERGGVVSSYPLQQVVGWRRRRRRKTQTIV
jgi:hypothetical protein